jgi:hypothetical protein
MEAVSRAVLWVYRVEALVVAGCNSLCSPFLTRGSTWHGVHCKSMERVSLENLPTEMQVQLFAATRLSASIADWVSVFSISKALQAVVYTAFGEWVSSHTPGTHFGRYGGSAGEQRFVREHVKGKYPL